VLHSHYPRSDAEETEATLRAYTDTGLRVCGELLICVENQ
jgi:hypothetical protein